MRTVIDRFLNHWISKKLFAFLITLGVVLYSIKTGSEVPDGFFHMAIAYVGSQGFVDAAAKYKGV